MISLELMLAARLQMQAAAADCMKGTSGDLFVWERERVRARARAGENVAASVQLGSDHKN